MMVIFDIDGTLTPLRQGSAGPWERRLLPEAEAALAFAREQGARIAIVTNQSRQRPVFDFLAHLDWTRRKVRELTGVWPFAYWSFDQKTKKPAPDMLLLAMRDAEVSPSETTMIGDSDDDRIAAERANVRFLHIDTFG